MRLPWPVGGRSSGRPALDPHPRATGAAREVVATHRVATGPQRLAWVAMPADGLVGHGGLVHLGWRGPGLLRPGDASEAEGQPLHSVAQLTVLRQGSVEHRDTLGNRGVVEGPTLMMISGGSGVVSQIEPSRAVRRDGGTMDLMTVRWLQPGAPSVPTFRTAPIPPPRRQGRSTITTLVGGGDAGLRDPSGTQVMDVTVAAGSTVDLQVPTDGAIAVVVRAGTALIGEGLAAVEGLHTAILSADAPRLTIATHLEGGDGAHVIVISTAVTAPVMAHRGGLIAAQDEQLLAQVLERAETEGFGPLPRLDG
ncbi:MAG: hypothetical protein ACR2HR_15280 [Euzebya sp.]